MKKKKLEKKVKKLEKRMKEFESAFEICDFDGGCGCHEDEETEKTDSEEVNDENKE